VGTANRRAGAYEYLVGPVPVEVEALQVAGCEPVESDAGLGGDDDLLFWCQIIASGLKLGVDVPDQRQFVERAGDQLGCVVVIEATPAWEHLREVVVEACVCRRRVQLAMSPDGLGECHTPLLEDFVHLEHTWLDRQWPGNTALGPER